MNPFEHEKYMLIEILLLIGLFLIAMFLAVKVHHWHQNNPLLVNILIYLFCLIIGIAGLLIAILGIVNVLRKKNNKPNGKER